MKNIDEQPASGAASTLKNLTSLHGSPRRVVLKLLGAGTLAGLFEAAALVAFINAAVRVTTGKESPVEVGPFSFGASASALLLFAAAATLASAGLHAVLARLITNGSLDVLRNARAKVMTAFLEARWPTQAEMPDGVVQDSVFHLANSASILAVFSLAALNGAVILVALLIAAAVVSTTITAALFVALIPILILLRPVIRLARGRAKRAVGDVTNFSEEVASTTAMAMEIHAFGVADQQLGRLDELNNEATNTMRKVRFSTRLAAFWFKDLALLMLIVVVGAINLIWSLEESSATAAILLMVRGLGYAQQTYTAYTHVVELAPGVDELVDRAAALADHPVQSGTASLSSIGRLRLDHVGYRYPNGHQALADVSVELHPGRVIGLVGPSGAGKSTLAEILLRLRQPTNGEITVDGTPIDQIRIEDWRRLVAFVPQEPRVWRRSVADNISFMRTEFGRHEVVAAARLAHLDADIVAMPQGYDTMLGTQSRGLSGGQRQRLAIARALISDPALIVLDEPTSALDGHSEQYVQRTLEDLRGKVTIVIIAHRLSTLDVCDDLVIVEDGAVTAAGPRAELIESHPFFTMLSEADLDAGRLS